MVALTPDRVSEVAVPRDPFAVLRAIAGPENRPVVARAAVGELARCVPAGADAVVAVAAVDAVEVVASRDLVVAGVPEQAVAAAGALDDVVAVVAPAAVAVVGPEHGLGPDGAAAPAAA